MSGSPGGMSAEARAFMAASTPPNVDPAQGKTMAEIRAEARAAYAPAAQKAIEMHGVETADLTIAGVPCLEVRPPRQTAGGTILYFFGGGFMLGSPFEDLPISAALSAGTGARVVAVAYPLAPEHPFPAALDACFRVAEALIADGHDLVLAGESAGGNLVLALAHRLRRAGLRMPRALAALSPATDLGDMGDSAEADRDPFLARARTADVTEAYASGRDLTDPDLSPIFGAFDASFPPTIVTTGTRDLLLSSSVKLARVMREAGAPVDLRVWEGMWHVFEFYPDLPEAKASLAEIAAFLKPYL
jgi:monoterpene epsilon-lactone hydrolase